MEPKTYTETEVRKLVQAAATLALLEKPVLSVGSILRATDKLIVMFRGKELK